MKAFVILLLFFVGVFLGSIIGQIGYRLPKKISLWKKSFCPKCGHTLSFWEKIPLLSYGIEHGRCKTCKKKISFFYPLLELSMGILLPLSYLIFGFSKEFVFASLLSSFFLLVTMTDFHDFVIPDEATYFYIVVALILKFLLSDSLGGGLQVVLLCLLHGFLLLFFLYGMMLLGKKIYKREVLGGGDVKLSFFIGILFPFPESLFVLFIATLFALLISLLVYFLEGKSILPFGPFLLFSSLLFYFLPVDFSFFFEKAGPVGFLLHF